MGLCKARRLQTKNCSLECDTLSSTGPEIVDFSPFNDWKTLRIFLLQFGITPLGNDPEWFKIARFLSGNVPKWGQYLVGVFPVCNTKPLRKTEYMYLTASVHVTTDAALRAAPATRTQCTTQYAQTSRRVLTNYALGLPSE